MHSCFSVNKGFHKIKKRQNAVLQMIKNKPPCRHIAYKTRTKQVGKRPIASRSLRPETGRSAVHNRS